MSPSIAEGTLVHTSGDPIMTAHPNPMAAVFYSGGSTLGAIVEKWAVGPVCADGTLRTRPAA
jgi:hypothetical protein